MDLDFKLLFEESPDVLLVLLPDEPRFTMVAATRARLAATHTTHEQILGRGLFDVFPDNPDDPRADGTSNLRASLARVLATRRPDTMAVQKYDIRGTDGAFVARHWSPKNIPVLSDNGEVLCIIHRVEDVTALVEASARGTELLGRTREMEREVVARSRELDQTNRELRVAAARLAELDVAKTAFFSNVSHEFRTPLALMLGPLEDVLACTAEPLTGAQRGHLVLAHQNALRLLKLVNTLLDFSRLDAGRLRAHYAPLDVGAFTAQLAGMFQSAAERAGIRLRIDSPALSRLVWVDREMWERIVPNILSNALKFTLAGEIAVEVREEAGGVTLAVSDTGIGIPESELPRLFERFHRVAGAAGRTSEGSGIGLSLVRELVHLHGGLVEVESAVGRGSTFRVHVPHGHAHLPPDQVFHERVEGPLGRDVEAYALEASHLPVELRAETPASEARPSPGDDDQRPRVLVVDDNPDLRGYVVGLLQERYATSTAADGQAALELARAARPDLVLSDVMMPRMDGFALARALRADPVTASVPIILLSARAGGESSIDGLSAGADDYVVKPFSAAELLARVRTHVNLARARQRWIRDLEIANRELDSFSYSVSHDLRAPLRTIEGFARILEEGATAGLSEEGREALERILANVHTMRGLIDGLLDLSRVTRTAATFGPVDLSGLAAEVAEDLRRADRGRVVDLVIEPGLLARGDRPLLRSALANLLGNAWKFTAGSASPRIEFGREGSGERAYFVRDNGAGFDAAYRDKLFTPFRRLHSQSEFEGSGVGLATVARIVARHGGRTWADGRVGLGATFYFTLGTAE